jgi:hypothetical protein
VHADLLVISELSRRHVLAKGAEQIFGALVWLTRGVAHQEPPCCWMIITRKPWRAKAWLAPRGLSRSPGKVGTAAFAMLSRRRDERAMLVSRD